MCSNGNKFQLRTWFIKKSNQARSLNSLKASISLEPLPVILLRCRSLVVCITTFPEVIQHLKLLHNLLADRTLDAEEVDCGCPPMQLSCEVTWGDFRLLTELQKIIENVLHCEEWAGGSSTGLALSKSSSTVRSAGDALMFWYFADLVHDSILLSVAMLDVYTQPLVGAPGASCKHSLRPLPSPYRWPSWVCYQALA